MISRRALMGLVTAAGLAAGGCGGSGVAAAGTAGSGAPLVATATSSATGSRSASATTSRASVPPAHTRPHRRPHRTPDPGRLPQTTQLPSAATPTFKAEMSDLWRAIQLGTLGPALPAFFPEAAYVQVKAIANAQSDYRYRLIADYALDIQAAHALLGSDPRAARLVRVIVPQSYAHWVDPNACYNRYGYYEVPNSRVVYRAAGQLRSFGIASMISWRGVWYVVHLGAVLRSSAAGVVDDPSSGTGVSAPSSTC